MKVTVKSIEKKQWGEKTFYDIQVENDPRQFSCWDDSVANWKAGAEVEAEIREKKTEGGKRYYIGAAGQAQKRGGGWQPRDKKEIAINCATAITCKMVEKVSVFDTKDTVAALEFFFEAIYNRIKD